MALGEDEASEKSWPVPVRLAVDGPVEVVTVRVPVREPPWVGSKKTPIEQLAPAATVLLQALSEPKSFALVVTLEIVTVEELLFVSVTVCGRPDVPTY